jgi:hypothetical protein
MDDGWGRRGGAAEAEGGEETKLREEPEAEADKRTRVDDSAGGGMGTHVKFDSSGEGGRQAGGMGTHVKFDSSCKAWALT